MFSKFAYWMSKKLGHSSAFLIALLLIITWLLVGPIFKFSDTWQLVVNTGTTIVTFLIVFLLQNTQNRDSRAIHLKLDEIIRAQNSISQEFLNIEELSEDELENMIKKNHPEIIKKNAKNKDTTLANLEEQTEIS